MVDLNDITVAEVSGIIAASAAAIQFFIFLALPLLMVGLFKGKEAFTTSSAVSWSVIGSFLHNSLWPNLLGSDSAAIRGVPKRLVLLVRSKVILALILSIAATITPLGLYQVILPGSSPTTSTFHYIVDNSEFGYGTPPRTDLPWSRICGDFYPVACPNSFTNLTEFANATGVYENVTYYDSNVPQYVIDVFESGLANMSPSVSSIFDIQSRSYTWSPINNVPGATEPDGGASYPVAAYRQIASLVTSNAYELIDGLIVDMKNGGIGFRNHSAPPVTPYGSTWSEDILFIEPESQCVDTNLTIDFMLKYYEANSSFIDGPVNIVLTDRGGFANLTRVYPEWDRSDPQNNPELFARAYKAAWLNNVYSMAFMNITNPRNESDPNSHAFEYLNSNVGDTFPLTDLSGSASYGLSTNVNQLVTSTLFGNYLSGLDQEIPATNTTNTEGQNITIPAKPPRYKNPFGITFDNFDDIGILCEGQGGEDYANISNFAAVCGLVYGAPRLQGGGDSIVFKPGSNWTIPLYSCISVAKAQVKTVSFNFNGSDDLSGLTVTDISNKEYSNQTDLPLWGVEQTTDYLRDVTALWGIVSGPNQGNVSLSTLQKESLYLPGYSGDPAFYTLPSFENLPGVDFYTAALNNVYDIGAPVAGMFDYSGYSSLGLFRMWQKYSQSAAGASTILNLIWTDVAANAVVGTKSIQDLGGSDAQNSGNGTSSSSPAITVYQRRVRYHYEYFVPAAVILFFTGLIALSVAITIVIGRSGLKKMRGFLNRTSQGRIVTSRLYYNAEIWKGEAEPEVVSKSIPTAAPIPISTGGPHAPTSTLSLLASRKLTRAWVRSIGQQPVTIIENPDETLVVNVHNFPQGPPTITPQQDMVERLAVSDPKSS